VISGVAKFPVVTLDTVAPTEAMLVSIVHTPQGLKVDVARMVNIAHHMTHVWYWRPRLGEKDRKGMKCRILLRAKKNTIAVELEDGEQVVCSRNAVRLIK
jgi:hypothetical protein